MLGNCLTGSLAEGINVVPVSVAITTDTLTPISAFLRLCKSEHSAFLLDSVEGGETIARYSFMGVDPIATVSIQNNQTVVTSMGKKQVLPGPPLQALRKYLEQYSSQPHPEQPPFCGGAVGYIGYDCVRFIEKVPTAKGPASDETAQLMIFRNVIAFDRLRSQVIVVCNVFLDHEAWEPGRIRAIEEAHVLIELLRQPSPAEQALTFGKENILPIKYQTTGQRSEVEEKIREVKKYIRAGDIFQCVLSERFTTDFAADPFTVYRTLRSLNPSPYMFYLKMQDQILLGASPERLVKVENGAIETCPIAGTRPRGKTALEDAKYEEQLFASVKEKAEHLMLVDLGRNDIGRVAKPGTVKVEEFMKVHRFSNVMHLTSLVRGELRRGLTAWDAFFSCFPAGTLTGAPKIRAMEIIASLEECARGPYGGAVIYYDFSGKLDSCITIRSLHIKDGKAAVQAGAGVVADSSPHREYDEILHKSDSVKRALHMVGTEAAR